MSNVMSKEAKKTFSSVEEIPDHYLVRKGSIPFEFQPNRLEEYFEPREVGLDHCFEPQEEHPRDVWRPWEKIRNTKTWLFPTKLDAV